MYETSMPAILAVNPCEKIVSLLHDGHDRVIHAAIYALAKLAWWPEGAQAVISANALAHLSKLLKSSNQGIRRQSCTPVGRLAIHDTSVPAILAVMPFERMVSILQAIYALANLSRSSAGAQAVVAANALTHLSKLLDSSYANTRMCSCDLIGNLAIHETMPAILEVIPFEKMVSLLHDGHDQVIHAAIYALAKLAWWPEGAQTVITANTLAHLSRLLESSNANIRRWSCDLVGILAIHDTSAPAILAVMPFERMLSLLYDGNDSVIRAAKDALANVAQWPEAADIRGWLQQRITPQP
ncbi:armadillo-type protein [Mycena pura]|uniref:Vacuolar protein 8 n=1 Tax=Mycena pura TaxID=153505 RepID=A0AAD6VCE3_9AGAR|nr:armadillo-type protein [Mycena pura]